MYQIRKLSKFSGITSFQTDDNDKLDVIGRSVISMDYCPLDVDYQNAAISYNDDVGMTEADTLRTKMSEEHIAECCYAFAMTRLDKNDQDMFAYGSDYLTYTAELSGESPLTLLNNHLNNIYTHYGLNGPAGSTEGFRESVRSYYKDVLNYGKPAAMIQAMMDHQKVTGVSVEQDFSAAVAGISGSNTQMEQ